MNSQWRERDVHLIWSCCPAMVPPVHNLEESDMQRMRAKTIALAIAALLFGAIGVAAPASAGPFAGAKTAHVKGAGSVLRQPVHYRKRYHKHRKYRGYKRRYRHRHHRRSRRRGGPVIVDAPFTHVYVGRGVRVRAPFVDIWVPRYRRHHRRYGYRYW